MADQTEEKLWLVEEILDKRRVKGKVEYFVKWEGFDVEHNSWEPAGNFSKELIAEYEQRRKAQRVGAAPNAPTTQAAAPVAPAAAPIMIPTVGPVRPVAAPTGAPGAAPAADAANGDDIVTGDYLVGRAVTGILGMGLADIETNGGLTQLRCYRCRFDDGSVRYVPSAAVSADPDARLLMINFLETHIQNP
ncbi:hypothetical protein CAEBREN_07771 [Caenorhabditis brenneri]|uniref:Chromo domain-containing protein n=1 Tax=Caenorhabditis brenneri TaxID=135651 RepID=G0N1X6_CAEBE|nr:hypothetical protein CAEBREN_07771 [Caenorhabditis brenneri]